MAADAAVEIVEIASVMATVAAFKNVNNAAAITTIGGASREG